MWSLALACASPEWVEVADFGSNPGALRMFEHVPAGEDLPLVLFLHGCTQGHDAARAAGFLELSEERGFVLVSAQQSALNNLNLCFRWFSEADTTGGGEALSLAQMVDSAKERHSVDPDRVYVSGLSAGAAMAVALLAVHPDVFDAGASVAGGPFGCAAGVIDAAACMGADHALSTAEWADRVRDANDHDGEWPRLLALHGDEDSVVDPDNSDLLTAQWAELGGLEANAGSTVATSNGDARVASFGARQVEEVRFPGLDHALPVCPDEACGETAPFLVDIGFCASRYIGDFFGL